ncbi:unnamed protein product [Rotaria sp. Silwood1]|nr:unnamed protein product [Rotaria sp. Silwood1]CAF1306941.1 unnamed protein product [Rotaria sp. Silwood1]CAF3504773.1 unnamed protein product [Rotaria sp. Silwood1]CAF4723555.1 unnamed protein product [Rotaria sp. Silwood1]CAF4904805.1 unnamed protein product [Rotaria sp. Silwood1]
MLQFLAFFCGADTTVSCAIVYIHFFLLIYHYKKKPNGGKCDDPNAQSTDGSSANGSFGLWYANVTFSTGDYGLLTMTSPLRKGDGFYVFQECVHVHGMKLQHRCSLLVRNFTGGYTEHIHKDPKLVPQCPKSLLSPGLEIEIVIKIN